MHLQMHLRLFISVVYNATKHKEATTTQETQRSHRQTFVFCYTYTSKIKWEQLFLQETLNHLHFGLWLRKKQ